MYSCQLYFTSFFSGGTLNEFIFRLYIAIGVGGTLFHYVKLYI